MNRRIVFVLLSLSFVYHQALAHHEWVHQHMVKEAYKLLKAQLGYDIPIMKDRIGMTLYGPGGATWTNGTVVIGAWREDIDDPVWNVGGIECGFVASSTHFWNADLGDNSTINIANDLNWCPLSGGEIPNAYQKALKYYNGYWQVAAATDYCYKYEGRNARLYDINGQSIRWFEYHGLVNLYKTSYVYLYLATGTYFIQKDDGTTVKFVHYSSNNPLVMVLNDGTRDNIVWEVLGRIAHLLGDMSVPAHAHNDPHPCWVHINYGAGTIHVENGDVYELWAGGAGTGSEYDCNTPIAHVYGYDYGQSHASSQGGFINVSAKINPMRYLFYSTNQIADHFGSLATEYAVDYGGLWNPGDNDVNYYYSTDYYSELYNMMISLGPPVTNQSDFDQSKVPTMSSAYVFSMRAIAGLLHLFAKQAGLLPPSVYITGPSYAPCATGTWTANVSDGLPPFSYKWYHMWDCEGGGGELITASEPTITPNAPCSPTWNEVGTNSPTLELYLCCGDSYLRVDVTDALNRTASDQHYVIGNCGGTSAEKSRDVTLQIMSLPSVFHASQNYPNPFNPDTEISFALPEPSLVRITILDVLGREVFTVTDREYSAGYQHVTWNGTDGSGNKAGSGVYFYRITAIGQSGKQFTKVMKMALTK